MQLNLSDEQLQSVMSASILAAINDENRNQLIAGAIEYLLKPKSSGYRALTPMQEAFNEAIKNHARNAVAQAIADPDNSLRQAFDKVFLEAVQRFVGSKHEDLARNIAWGIERGLYREND